MRGVEVAIGAIVTLGALLLVFGRSSRSVALSDSVFAGTNNIFGTIGKAVS